MANRRFTSQYLYNFQKKLVMLTSKVTVAATNANGVTGFVATPQAGAFGAPSASTTLYGYGINQIYMHSSAPAAANYCLAGQIAVQFQDNYQMFLGLDYTVAGPVSGGAVNISAGLTVGTFYQIVTLGTSTTANFQAVGLPAGVTAAVGAVFQASTASAGTGTGTVKVLGASTITDIEVAGDPNYTLQPTGQANGFNGGAGGWLFLNIFGPTNSTTTTPVLTQPPDGTILTLNFFMASP